MTDWRTYDSIAETYEEVHAPLLAHPARELVELAAIPERARVLDIGTGTGVTAEAARSASPGAVVVGLDASPPMLAIARRERPDIPLVAAQAIDLPFRDATFDVVLGNFVLSHFKKYETALFDIVRVTRPGGRCAFSVWGREIEDEFQRTWRQLVEGSVGPQMLRTAQKDAAPWEEHFSDPARLDRTLRDMGLRPVTVEKREYRFRLSLEDYIRSRETHYSGRFVHKMLGDRLWGGFRQRARDTYAQKFGEQIGDYRRVLLAVGTKP